MCLSSFFPLRKKCGMHLGIFNSLSSLCPFSSCSQVHPIKPPALLKTTGTGITLTWLQSSRVMGLLPLAFLKLHVSHQCSFASVSSSPYSTEYPLTRILLIIVLLSGSQSPTSMVFVNSPLVHIPRLCVWEYPITTLHAVLGVRLVHLKEVLLKTHHLLGHV